MQHLVGIDIGTTAVKSVCFDSNGRAVYTASKEYAMLHTAPDRAEQNADAIINAVVQVMRDTFSAKGEPEFVSFSSAMHSLVTVDDNGEALTPLIIWADNRASGITSALYENGKAKAWYQKTGVPVHPMSPLCKLYWLRENESSLYQNAAKFIGIKEYIFYRLINRYVVDTSIASATGLLNIHHLDWDEDILKDLGLSRKKLSQLVPADAVFIAEPKDPGLKFLSGIKLVAGASDGALSNLGSFAVGDIMAVSIGTSSAARLLTNHPLLDDDMRTFCYHLRGNQYVTGGAGNNGAVVLQWLRENILETTESYETLFERAAGVDAGAEGIVFLPYILGERAPWWNISATAVLFGLSKHHRQEHIIRAAIESVIYAVYSIAQPVMKTNKVTAIHVSGGFARSKLWLQMLADVFNIPVHQAASYEAASCGAVMIGAEACRIPLKFTCHIEASFYPQPAMHEKYGLVYAQFLRLYHLLSNEMRDRPVY